MSGNSSDSESQCLPSDNLKSCLLPILKSLPQPCQSALGTTAGYSGSTSSMGNEQSNTSSSSDSQSSQNKNQNLSLKPLEACRKLIDVDYLFQTDWYVNICTVTPFDGPEPFDAIERYRWVKKNKTFKVIYKYRQGSHEAKGETMFQDGRIPNVEDDGEDGTPEKSKLYKSEWRVRPRFFNDLIPLPLWLPYIILDAPTPSDPHQLFIVGYPDRSMLWVMSRKPDLTDTEYKAVVDRCANEWKYDRKKVLEKLFRIPHKEEAYLEYSG